MKASSTSAMTTANGFETGLPTNGRRVLKCKAGVALLRRNRRRTEVLLVQQANGLWSLPKGKRKLGESIRQACLRECREETGYEAEALHFIGWGASKRKCFRFYLWKSESYRSVAANGAQTILRPYEILGLAWVGLSQAKQMLKAWQACLLERVSIGESRGDF